MSFSDSVFFLLIYLLRKPRRGWVKFSKKERWMWISDMPQSCDVKICYKSPFVPKWKYVYFQLFFVVNFKILLKNLCIRVPPRNLHISIVAPVKQDYRRLWSWDATLTNMKQECFGDVEKSGYVTIDLTLNSPIVCILYLYIQSAASARSLNLPKNLSCSFKWFAGNLGASSISSLKDPL